MATNIDDKLVRDLIAATTHLVTVCDLASNNLSEQFQNMIRVPVSNVRDILSSFPAEITNMTREFSEDDCSISFGDGPNGLGTRVHILHKPTGIGRESYSKLSREENKDVAMRSLAEEVKKEYDSRV